MSDGSGCDELNESQAEEANHAPLPQNNGAEQLEIHTQPGWCVMGHYENYHWIVY